MTAINSQLAVSTWSLHRALDRGEMTLLDIPAQAAAHGIGRLEICHFHFPSTEASYLAELRSALDAAGVQFFTLLIDDFDLTDPDLAQRRHAAEMIDVWLNIAGSCGAKRARVIAGRQPPNKQTLELSILGLEARCQQASNVGVQVVTENYQALLAGPAEVAAIMNALGEKIGLMLDFGNWKGPDKYASLAQIAPYATSTHAKAHYPAANQMDREDFIKCLEICQGAGFSGPHSLIFDGPGDEWSSLDQIRDAVLPYVSQATK